MTKRTWTRTIVIIVVTSSISGRMLDYTTSTESSADYLRKVMMELQGMNLQPSTSPVRPGEQVFFDVDDKHYLAGKRFSNGKKLILPPVSENQEDSVLRPTIHHSTGKKLEPLPIDQAFAESATHNQYYQIPGPVIVPAPQKVAGPEVAPLTKAELAAVYKNVVGKGSVASLNALVDVLRSRLPAVQPNPVEIAPAQPVYSYYFYPLKSFMNDVRHQHALHAAQDSKPANTGLMEETQKQAANPLFVAISGFVGVAVLFMVGVLLMPRIFGDFHFRNSDENDDDFLDLTKTINEAMDNENCTEHTAYKRIDKRTAFTTRPMITRPSSVVLLTTKSVRPKDIAKRRRKIQRSCKVGDCKKINRRLANSER